MLAEGKHPLFVLGNINLPSINETESLQLEEEFSLEEIEFALKDSDPNKAPGPDGLNMGFLKTIWKLIRGDVLTLFEDFYNGINLPRGLNSSFIALIPKKDRPNEASDFRPISLINCSLKLLNKVLVNRLKEVLQGTISTTQSRIKTSRMVS